jgi:hypothetical protein
MSSCRELQEDIELYGKESFTFVIYRWCMGKGLLTYYECEDQWMAGVLEKEELPCGERVWYNRQISGVQFLKPNETK